MLYTLFQRSCHSDLTGKVGSVAATRIRRISGGSVQPIHHTVMACHVMVLSCVLLRSVWVLCAGRNYMISNLFFQEKCSGVTA